MPPSRADVCPCDSTRAGALLCASAQGNLSPPPDQIRKLRPMSIAEAAISTRDETLEPCVVEIVVPVFNEARVLEASVTRLRRYLDDHFPFRSTIVIADNGSTDGTWRLAQHLSARLDGVEAMRIARPGRGQALRTAWSVGNAAVVAYMDVDLSTDLDALLPLVAPLLSGHSDLAIGSRLAPGARITRSLKREVISRAYNLIVRATLGARISDAQCGFKALSAAAARLLIPMVEDDGWFFDTELLVLAERHGLRVHEVPVDWVEDPDSRVKLVRTAWEDLKGIRRLRRSRTVPARRPRLDSRQPVLSGGGNHR